MNNNVSFRYHLKYAGLGLLGQLTALPLQYIY